MNTQNYKRIPMSDEKIVQMYLERDENAILESDLKYGKYLFSVSYNILHNKLDSEECVNDTYLGAWNSIPPNRPHSLQAFLLTIVRRISINRYHKNSKKSSVPTAMTVSLSELDDCVFCGGSEDSFFDAKRLGEIISRFVRDLPPRKQYIFMSRYYVADSLETIAKELNLSRAMIKKDLATIRGALKETLEKEGYFL